MTASSLRRKRCVDKYCLVSHAVEYQITKLLRVGAGSKGTELILYYQPVFLEYMSLLLGDPDGEFRIFNVGCVVTGNQ